jgi:hypothetical protein
MKVVEFKKYSKESRGWISRFSTVYELVSLVDLDFREEIGDETRRNKM